MTSRSLSSSSVVRPSTSSFQIPIRTKEHGSIRLYSADGERSTVGTLTMSTTAGEIASNYKVDSLFLQMGFHIRQLSPGERPLDIYSQFIRSIGFDMDIIRNFSSQEIMRNIIVFYLGRPTFRPSNGVRSEIQMAESDVRRGKLMPKWSRCRCILHNGGIRILRGTDEGDLIPLVNKKIDTYESKRGRCLRIQDSVSTTLFRFDDDNTLHQWLFLCLQNMQSTSMDLSDQRLTLLPESLFVSPEQIRRLNLRRNSLLFRRTDETALVGHLDDFSRLQNLTSLDLSFNDLNHFPLPITDLSLIETLNLSSNRIEEIPQELSKLKRLSSFDISNNCLFSLPNNFVECPSLASLNLSFNHFKKIPLVLTRLDLVKHWQLAGNIIERVENYGSSLENLQKIDLRRNSLEATFRLPVGSYEQLTHVDLRDNQKVSAVSLTNTPALRVLLCSRLQLTSIQLNGQSLTHLFVDHNLLDSLIIMPTPTRLQVVDVSHNLFESLPDWICDLQHLTAIRANHNRLEKLPSRIFCMSSLRLLCAFNNNISELATSFDDSILDTILLQNNKLRELPADLFKALSRLRQLNVSFNELNSLPSPSLNVDWNKLNVLRAAHNNLDESVVPSLVFLKRLKILDLTNNRLRYFDDSALNTLTLLEDINISSNLISTVSTAIPQLPALTHFRAHSNRIQSMPDLSQSLSLQLVDLSSNQITFFPPSMASAPALRSLDVSCNPLMQIDSGTISRSRRKKVAVVDVSYQTNRLQFGVSETTGSRNRLCIRKICNKSVFGIIDGGSNYEISKTIMNSINEQLEQMEEIDLKKIIVTTHLQLGEQGQQLGASIVLTHIHENFMTLVASGSIGVAVLSKENIIQLDTKKTLDEDDYKKIRKEGLWLDENNLINAVTSCPRQLGMFHFHPAISPDPVVIEGSINGVDTIIIGSRALWEHLSNHDISNIVNSTVNSQVAAKRLQDALQSCDYMGNSSIVVIKPPKPEVRFDSPGSSKSNLLPSTSSIPFREAKERVAELLNRSDDNHLTGKHLYNRILAEELEQRSISPSIAAPPDPEIEQERPTPTPRVTPPSYQDYIERQEEYPTEGSYNVFEQMRQFDHKVIRMNDEKGEDRETGQVEKRGRLGVIRETSESASELTLDEPFSFSHYSLEQNSSVLTPMEETLSSRYKFEYARSNLQENLRLSRSPALDL